LAFSRWRILRSASSWFESTPTARVNISHQNMETRVLCFLQSKYWTILSHYVMQNM
jgi:hypothetical protein